MTWLGPRAREPRAAPAAERRHAIVIGASIAGLVTARVLADRFARVTVLERHPACGGGDVSIAPHGRYPHVLLQGGGQALERLFPEFRGEALAAGAPVTARGSIRWWSGGWRVERRRDPGGRVQGSRGLFESIIRRQVAALPNVRVEYGAAIAGLAIEHGRVTGVRTATTRVDADFVVDCSGRGSRLPEWLAAAGRAPVPVSEIAVDLCYLSIALRRRTADLDGATTLVIQNMAPAMTRLGLALAVERERWMVVLGGYFGDMPPADRAGYTTFADSLPVPDLAQLLRSAEPIGDPLPYRFRSSRRVHAERCAAWPAGLAALGDATCSFNPLYGQGMSVAIMQAERLGELIDRHGTSTRLARRVQRELARTTDLAWQIAAGGDLAYPAVAGRRHPIGRVLRSYMARVFRACSVDAEVVDTLFDVTNLLAPPSRLLRPGVIARVLRAQPAAARRARTRRGGSWRAA